MLRPATPLSVLLLAAFGLLLLSVLSTPIVKSVPLGTFHGVSFGVFGYCNGGDCGPIEVGYDTSKIKPDDNASFDIPTSARTTLSAILIVHPIAAFLTLVMFVLAVVSHLHSPSHSARYLLLMFILSIVNFLVCLMAFLVDVLLFIPHLAWGSYIVLAATILVAVSGLVACAMRRTVVSRKARKKRIAENAEMSGENFYNRQAQVASVIPAAAVQPILPTASGANGGAGEKAAQFTAYESKDDRSSDERIPLTAMSPSDQFSTAAGNYRAASPADGQYSTINRPLTDSAVPPDGYALRSLPPQERRSRGGGNLPGGGYRGRGGYGGPGRGAYNGYAPPIPAGRGGYGGYGGPQRVGYGPPPGRGVYGPPQRGYGQNMRGGRPPPPSYHGSPGPYDHRASVAGSYGSDPLPYGARHPSPGLPSAPGYHTSRQPTPGTPSVPGYNANRQPSPGPPSAPRLNSNPASIAPSADYDVYKTGVQQSLPRAESPPPLAGVDDGLEPGRPYPHQPAAMNSQDGSSARLGQYVRDSGTDLAGMMALQQARLSISPRQMHTSDGSRYSDDDRSVYLPPRQARNQSSGRNSPTAPPPLNVTAHAPSARGNPASQQAASAGEYYEDVDPRFAPAVIHPKSSPPHPILTTNPYEDTSEGLRSPAESEHSHFTSISERGLNPRWQPPSSQPQMDAYGTGVIPRRPVNRPADMLLDSNPDFHVPARGNPPTRTPGGTYPTGPF